LIFSIGDLQRLPRPGPLVQTESRQDLTSLLSTRSLSAEVRAETPGRRCDSFMCARAPRVLVVRSASQVRRWKQEERERGGGGYISNISKGYDLCSCIFMLMDFFSGGQRSFCEEQQIKIFFFLSKCLFGETVLLFNCFAF